jgi:2-polyprenyl-6-methoxyphenol hydroxylase-like FAD-dependent oxidoreductase
MIDTSMNMPLNHVVIIGGGMSGLCSALALSRHVPDLRITVFERHPVPSTSGGAISLSPVALRHLDYLGVLLQLDGLGCEAGAEVDAIEVFSVRSVGFLGFCRQPKARIRDSVGLSSVQRKESDEDQLDTRDHGGY